MVLELKAETEALVREEVRRGNFGSVDELLVHAIEALRRHGGEVNEIRNPPESRKSIYELLTQPPFSGSGLSFERQKDSPRQVDL